jgi:NADH-ubiquinone oxidoreductase chain 5
LIGVVSYLLINYYYTRIQANKAAILALTMNRVGDMGLSIGFFALFALFGSVDYATIFSLAPFMNETAITIISLLLLMGAMAKSAQIPLHSWLPGSMEAPTPVSALLHAATLVTAGLYLLVRSSPILEYSSTALLIITLVGATTAFFAATCGLVQNDLKRIIAFSTISQLGYFSYIDLILTILFFLSETAFIFYYYSKFIYINYDIPVLAFGPFFSTTILHIPKKNF